MIDRDRKLVRNAAQCLRCLDIIESVHRHDYKTCRCGLISVDGGKNYWRRSTNGVEETDWIDLSTFVGDD